ncbi:MAG: toll/interleukin-1 receptor domain-containing protein, partial [Verrucomicrobia bacterium]|nr:toll/interleukin-1 receptor domain-containing protein [Verrucomicrobiota bacterium]
MKAFVSYSHHDAEFLTALHEHLSALRRQGFIDTWTDREIDAGGVVDHEISTAMAEAGLFLLLVSSSFINSDYCYEKEFKRALEKQAASKAIIVPILVRPCDWQIPELRQFKALPEDARPVRSQHWHSEDEAFANVAAGLRSLLDKRRKKKAKFVPDDSHVTQDQRKELNKVHHEIVERLIAKKSHMDDERVRRAFGKWAGIVWDQFNETFGTKENGLQSLPVEKFEEAKQWLTQYRASKDSSLKRAKPQQYKNALTKTIYSVGGGLGWTKEEIYSFARDIVGYSTPIESLNDLGNSQLEKVRDKIRYEASKRRTKSAQAKAKKAPVFQHPVDDLAKELLKLILNHPVADERGLTEIFESPTG